MKHPSALVASLLFLCVSQAIALMIPSAKTMDDRILPKEYNPRPKGSATKQTETDEGRDLEYFYAPADKQGAAAADYLVDFKTNEFLRRVDRDGICYLGQLPDNLLKGSNLQTALSEVFDAHPSPQNKDIVGDYWVVTDKVDKTLLREEVQKFCDAGFPIHRVQKVELVSTDAEDDDERSNRRARRALSLWRLPLCPASVPYDCSPHDWLFDVKILGVLRTRWITCRLDKSIGDIDCGVTTWDHRHEHVICYQVRCP